MLSLNFRFQFQTLRRFLYPLTSLCLMSQWQYIRMNAVSMNHSLFFIQNHYFIFLNKKNFTCISKFLAYLKFFQAFVSEWRYGLNKNEAEGRQRRQKWGYLIYMEAARGQLHKRLTSISSSLS